MPEQRVSVEAGIDRELAALLAVEPSPEFKAKVRARIAAAPEPRRWTAWAPVAAAAAIVLVAGTMLMRTAGEPRRDGATVASTPSARPAAPPAIATASSGGGTVQAVRTRSRRVALAATHPAIEPEIVIDPALNLTVQRLLRGAEQRRPNLEAANAERNGVDAPPRDLSVAPVVVDELTVPVIKVGESPMGGRR